MAEITIADLTTTDIDGTGVFDQLMRATKAHLQEEYAKNRIRGPEYSQVYLSGLQAAMDQGIRFLLDKNNAELIAKQIELAEKQLLQADKDLLLADKALEKADKEIDLAQAQIDKMLFERDLTEQQVINMQAEALNIPKQGALLDQQVLNAEQDVLLSQQKVLQIAEELLLIPKQGDLLDAQEADTIASTAIKDQQKINLVAEALNIPKQGEMIDAQREVQEQQKINLVCEEVKCQKEVLQIVAETLNVPLQGDVLIAQECKLKGEFDLTVAQKARVENESALLVQKKITETAQTQDSAHASSAIGRQNEVLRLQANGFKRLAEQRAAEIMSELYQVQMGTDATVKSIDVMTPGKLTSVLTALQTGAAAS